MWSIASVLFLLAGIGWLLWYQRRRGDEAHAAVPAADPFLTMKPTPSMRRRPNIRHRHRDVARAILLFTGLMIWLTLVGRALWPALRTRNETRGLIAMVFIC